MVCGIIRVQNIQEKSGLADVAQQNEPMMNMPYARPNSISGRPQHIASVTSSSITARPSASCVSAVVGSRTLWARDPTSPVVRSYDAFGPQHQDGCHDPANEHEDTEPEDPAHPRPMPLLSTLALEPRVPVCGVSGHRRPKLESTLRAPRKTKG